MLSWLLDWFPGRGDDPDDGSRREEAAADAVRNAALRRAQSAALAAWRTLAPSVNGHAAVVALVEPSPGRFVYTTMRSMPRRRFAETLRQIADRIDAEIEAETAKEARP